MLIKSHDDGFHHPLGSEITSRSAYEGRRDMLRLMAAGAAGTVLATWAGRQALAQSATVRPGKLAALPSIASKVSGAVTMEKLTDYKDASTYNNFYEFGTDKADPARNSGRFQPKCRRSEPNHSSATQRSFHPHPRFRIAGRSEQPRPHR